MATNNTSGDVARRALSAMAVLSLFLVLASVGFQSPRPEISNEWVFVFVAIGLISLVVAVIAFFADFVMKGSEERNLIAQSFFIFEKNKLMPGSYFLPVGLVLGVVYAVLVVFLVTSTGSSFAPIPDPYTGALATSADSFSSQSAASNFWNGAVVPGFLEEALVFFSWQALRFFFLFGTMLFSGFSRNVNPALYWVVTVFSVGVASLVFSVVSHARYGGNVSIYVTLFGLEFVGQMINAFSGAFVSPLWHVAHNAAVIGFNAYSFVLSAVLGVPTSKAASLSRVVSHE